MRQAAEKLEGPALASWLEQVEVTEALEAYVRGSALTAGGSDYARPWEGLVRGRGTSAA